MKQCLVFTLLVTCVTALFAQQTPTIQRAKGLTFTFNKEVGDSATFTISNSKDTLLTELFFPNGLPCIQKWREDSTYFYRQFGQIIGKKYTFYEENTNQMIDSTVTYRLDGSLEESKTERSLQTKIVLFDDRNKVIETTIVSAYPDLHYSVTTTNNHKVKGEKHEIRLIGKDSLLFEFDTTFYTNSRIKTLKHKSYIRASLSDFRNLREEYYDEKGFLIHGLTPDSLRLFVFKDNINCYYGFKNRRGDTLIAPRFDNVKEAGYNFFICDEGVNKILMRRDGRVLTPPNTQQITQVKSLGPFDSDENDRPRYFSYFANNKYGLIDTSGRDMIPPQSIYHITSYDKDVPFFHFHEIGEGDLVRKSGLIDAITGEIIGNGRYKTVSTVNSNDFFTFSDSMGKKSNTYLGLINRHGDVVLPARYVSIQHFNGSLFLVTEASKKEIEKEIDLYEKSKTGLFDALNKRWIIKPSFQYIYFPSPISQVLYFPKIKKYGKIDSLGNWILQPVYDVIMSSDKSIVVKNGAYTLFDEVNRKIGAKTYSYLSSFSVDNLSRFSPSRFRQEVDNFYIAQQNGKYGILNMKEEVIVPFQYDYIGVDGGRWEKMAFVKDNKAHRILHQMYPVKLVGEGEFEMDALKKFELIEGDSSVFMINKNNDVIVPPQYKIISEYHIYGDRDDIVHQKATVIKNKQGVQKVVYSETGHILDYLFSQPIAWTQVNCPFIWLDTTSKERYFSIANLQTGRIVKTLKQGGLSLADSQNGSFFLKTTVPPLPLKDSELPDVFMDTLAVDDNDWVMYDVANKRISNAVFRFPIPFEDGVGLGMVGNKYGLWQSNGIELLAPQYENGIRMKKELFALFQNIGLKNWLVLFDKKGKNLVGTGRYDGISDFYGKYALVKNGEKVGLIDTLGREIVPLTDMPSAVNVNFKDSLDMGLAAIDTAKDAFLRHDVARHIFRYNWDKYNPDSLHLSEELRNMAWNRIMEVFFVKKMYTAGTSKIKRDISYKTYTVYNEIFEKVRLQDREVVQPEKLFELSADTSYIGFSVLKDTVDRSDYYNFVKKGKEWLPLSTNSLFNLHPDNTMKINGLLAHKISKLLDLDIDCGASSSFWERGQSRYLVSKEGITFYFVTKEDEESPTRDLEKTFVPIVLTWAELKPFLRH